MVYVAGAAIVRSEDPAEWSLEELVFEAASVQGGSVLRLPGDPGRRADQPPDRHRPGGRLPRERLRRLMVEQIRFTTYDNAELSRLFLQHLDWPKSIDRQLHEWHVRHDSIFKRVIEEGVAEGDFVLTDATVARQCLLGALSFVPFWGYKSAGRYSVDELVEVVADTVLPLFGRPQGPA